MSGISDVLIKTLESLNNNDFDKFKKYLERHGPISRQKLEKASIDNTVYMMVQAYCESDCGGVVSNILKKMNLNQLALDLEQDLHSESGTLELPEQMKQMKERMDKMDATMEKSNAQPHKNHKKNYLHHSSSSLNLQPPSPKVAEARNCEGNSAMAAEHDPTLRIVLVGHTGAGKSASGNTILADKAFKVECSSNAVTKFGEKKQGKVENKDILVIDTPGINDTEMTQEKLKSEIGRCIEMCAPGPHALLLVIRFNRFTMEQQAAVKWIQENFGEGALKYTIVLFTGKEELDGKSVEKFISENPCLQKLVKKCGDRYHAFNNNDISSLQVRELFSKIENMMKINHADCYTKEMYKSTHDLKARREKERKEKKNKRDRETEKEKEKAVLWKGVGAVAGALAGTATGAVIGSVAGPYFGGATVVVQVGAKAMTAATAATAGSATLGAGAGGLAGYGRGPKIRQLYNGLHNGVLNLVNDNSAEKEKTDYEM